MKFEWDLKLENGKIVVRSSETVEEAVRNYEADHPDERVVDTRQHFDWFVVGVHPRQIIG